MSANRHAFVSYRELSPDERHANTVLGLNGTSAPAGIGQINPPIEDDNGHVHHFRLDDIRYIPGVPINIVVPQMFAQQRASEGDPSARCVIEKDSMALEWTSEDGTPSSKYIPLSTANLGICRTAPGHSKFAQFASFFRHFTLPAYISDDEADDQLRASHDTLNKRRRRTSVGRFRRLSIVLKTGAAIEIAA